MNNIPPAAYDHNNSRRRGARFALMPLAAAVLCCAASFDARAAGALPAGGHFVGGNGSFSSDGTTLTISQGSGRGVVDWNSFSIGGGNRVVFANSNGATLNRVTGGSPSAILGTLSASGSVYLINPQGIVVGPRGVVSTNGRFVASTLDVADTDAFMNGQPLTLSGNSRAGVVNLGTIASGNGDIFLIARQVGNAGTISATNGTVELAAGQQVLLQDSSSGRQVFVQPSQLGAGATIVNGGLLQAAQVSLQAVDGNIYALAGNHEAIRATGTATRDGHVWLVAAHGTLQPGGLIDATGGTVDMSADTLAFPTGGTTVHANQWNIATPAFTVDNSAARALSTSLGTGTSVNCKPPAQTAVPATST
ncbi:MAG: Large exoproteins involved in heme utilization or adhesion [uncultured Paraburkholderia sp.]|nr:MAG: Large exoproteins involved in heme utilization or adhesion [uncultured Paraburkholderia sp.]